MQVTYLWPPWMTRSYHSRSASHALPSPPSSAHSPSRSWPSLPSPAASPPRTAASACSPCVIHDNAIKRWVGWLMRWVGCVLTVRGGGSLCLRLSASHSLTILSVLPRNREVYEGLRRCIPLLPRLRWVCSASRCRRWPWAWPPASVRRARLGRLSALSIRRRISSLCGAFVWARRALNS